MRRGNLVTLLVLVLCILGGAGLATLAGCDTYGTDDGCIGPDGYNWCIAGGGWGEIHTPSVQSWDFTDW